jgi:DNA-binding transcriptional ArsR family regulator
MNTPQIDTSLTHLAAYISQVYKPCALKSPWPLTKDLPLYLQGGWTYRLLTVGGYECLLMLDEREQPDTAQRLKKTINSITSYFNGPVIYGVRELESYNRKRLIDQGIAFVVPGKQLYLPFMALDLRENFAAEASVELTRLGACAQQLLLIRLFGLWQTETSAQMLANRLGVSKMTVSRAYRELTELGLAKAVMVGRTSQLVFEPDNHQLWLAAKPYLSSPVKKQVWLSAQQYHQHGNLFQLAAGEWALSMLGMLSRPKHPCYAVSANDWASLKKLTGIEQQAHPDDDSIVLELWRYDPSWLKAYVNVVETVDKLSLFLSLLANDDDRIQIALDDLVSEFLEDGKV